jgi:two-component system LytT family response regulator
MTAIIVEDMPPALAALKAELQNFCPNVEIIGTAGSVVDAAKLLRTTKPDLLFLGIILGDGTSLDILEIVPDITAELIFTTASDEFAVRALRFAAVDYLLKPVEGAMLKAAVDRAMRRITFRKGSPDTASLDLLKETIRQPEALPDRISLHTSENIVVAKIKDIIRCEADSSNIRFVFAGDEKSAFVTKSLKYYERMLTGYGFVRVDQSNLVNFDEVVEFKNIDSGYLRLSNGDEVPVANRKRAEVVRMLR